MNDAAKVHKPLSAVGSSAAGDHADSVLPRGAIPGLSVAAFASGIVGFRQVLIVNTLMIGITVSLFSFVVSGTPVSVIVILSLAQGFFNSSALQNPANPHEC